MLTIKSPEKVDWANMSLEDMSYGNALDCDMTRQCGELMLLDLQKEKSLPIYEKCLRHILPMMAEVENRGLLVDTVELKRITSLLTESLKALESSMLEILKTHLNLTDKVNLSSPVQISSILFDKGTGFGLPVFKTSKKTQKPSTDKDHIQKVFDHVKGLRSYSEAKEFLVSFIEYKDKKKLLDTYATGINQALDYNEDGRVYSQYNFANVVTGRLSCSGYQISKLVEGKNGRMLNKKFKKGVSFHTLPRRDEKKKKDINIRNMFIADEGYAFISADYSAAELRVLAHVSQDKNLIAAFKSGEDLHKYTASLVFNLPILSITDSQRQIAKSVSFLIVYGGGPDKLAESVGITEEEARKVFLSFFRAYPGVKKWMKSAGEEIQKNKYAESIFGRRRHLPNVDSPFKNKAFQAIRQGINFIIQSSASDIMLHGIVAFNSRVRAYPNLGYEMLATVHDSIEIQVPKRKCLQGAKFLKQALSDMSIIYGLYGINFSVPMEVDVEIGSSFGDGEKVEFDKTGYILNGKELTEHVEKQTNSRTYRLAS
jgi:DNA polymerase I